MHTLRDVASVVLSQERLASWVPSVRREPWVHKEQQASRELLEVRGRLAELEPPV